MTAQTPPRVLLLPGWLGSGPGHWQRRWQAVYADTLVEQADWVTPRRGDWIARLEDVIVAQPGTVALAAHSLGCHLVAAWAASSRHVHRVACALLVAPPDLQRPDLPQALLPWRRPLTSLPLPFVASVAYSADDPYACTTASRQLAATWGAHAIDLGRCGHVNADSALGDWPQGRELLDALLQRVRHNPSPDSV
ncbi:MAG: RBBP9/YdeN family alpha/beta hydrolase [Thiomonas sp.]|jgi:predicted alpha/beta hydrolase family esterase